MKKLIIFALAAISFAACSNQPKVMENEAIQNIMTRVSVREFTGEKISEAQLDTLLRAAMPLLRLSTNSLGPSLS